jgi:uncharacterized protein
LLGFYAMTFAFTWIWDVLAFGVWHLDPSGVGLAFGPFLDPTLAAFVTTASIDAGSGVLRHLRRYVLWRVPIQWYVGLSAWYARLDAGKRAHSAQYPCDLPFPPAALALGFVQLFVTIFIFGGPLGEEPGWRGFGLPRLQERAPWSARGQPVLRGGVEHLPVYLLVWHLPVYLLVPGYSGAGTGIIGIGIPFAQFRVATTASAFMFTWLFNKSRGSLLLTMLLHVSINASGIVLQFSQVPAQTQDQLLAMRTVEWLIVAMLLIGTTRGKLAYPGRQSPPAENQLMAHALSR